MLEQISKVSGHSKVFNIVSVKNVQCMKHFLLSTCLESCWKPYSNESRPQS